MFFKGNDDDQSISTVDEPHIESLLAQRLVHTENGDYEQADDIRDELSLQDITVWDKERIWTNNPDSRGWNARHRNGGRYNTSNAQRRGDRNDERDENLWEWYRQPTSCGRGTRLHPSPRLVHLHINPRQNKRRNSATSLLQETTRFRSVGRPPEAAERRARDLHPRSRQGVTPRRSEGCGSKIGKIVFPSPHDRNRYGFHASATSER